MGRARFLLMIALSLVGVATASADDWPMRPVTMVVPFAPGGVYDTLGRVYAAALSDSLGHQVIVENVPGAGSMTGAARVAKADPDGYEILFGGESPNAQVQLLHKAPPYDAATDFAPVALVAQQPLILAARPGIPAGNLADFIAYAKGNQAKMQYGSPGTGTGSHLACALLDTAIGIAVTHVPYRGLAPAMQDLLAGRIDYMCPTITTAMAQVQAKEVQAPAVLGRERSPTFPDIATAERAGAERLRRQWLERHIPAQGDAGADRRQAQRRDARRHGHARGAAARARARRVAAAAGPSHAAISAELRRKRDQELGRGHRHRGDYGGVAPIRRNTNSVSS